MYSQSLIPVIPTTVVAPTTVSPWGPLLNVPASMDLNLIPTSVLASTSMNVQRIEEIVRIDVLTRRVRTVACVTPVTNSEPIKERATVSKLSTVYVLS